MLLTSEHGLGEPSEVRFRRDVMTSTDYTESLALTRLTHRLTTLIALLALPSAKRQRRELSWLATLYLPKPGGPT